MKMSIKEAYYSFKRDVIANTFIILMITLLLGIYAIIASYYFELPNNNFSTNAHFLYLHASDEDERYKQLSASSKVSWHSNNLSYTLNAIDALYSLEGITFFRCVEDGIALPKADFLSKVPQEEWNHFASNMAFNMEAAIAMTNNTDMDFLDSQKALYDMPREMSYYNDSFLEQPAVTVAAFRLDQNAIDYFDLAVCRGRLFEPQEYILNSLDDEISILMGYDYMDKYSIDETIEVNLSNSVFQARIVGFLEKGNTVNILEPYSLETTALTLDNAIVSPILNLNFEPTEDKNLFVSTYYYGSLYHGGGIVIPPDTTPKELSTYQMQVKDIFLNNGLPPLVFAEPTFGFLYFMNETEPTIQLLLWISIAMVLFDLVILFLFFISKVNRNMSRYAILIMNGWSVNAVILACVLEVIVLVLLPVCCIFIIAFHQIANNVMYILLILCFAAILILVIYAFISAKLRKLDIEKLIRGAE